MDERITLEEYQVGVEATWIPSKKPEHEELRIVYGIIGELGEIAELNKKWMRDGGDPDVWRKRFEAEFGDFMYYVAKFANYFDVQLEDVLVNNSIKLFDRKERGVIKGSGSNR